MAFPAWLATIEQVPLPTIVTVMPATVQRPGVRRSEPHREPGIGRCADRERRDAIGHGVQRCESNRLCCSADYGAQQHRYVVVTVSAVARSAMPSPLKSAHRHGKKDPFPPETGFPSPRRTRPGRSPATALHCCRPRVPARPRYRFYNQILNAIAVEIPYRQGNRTRVQRQTGSLALARTRPSVPQKYRDVVAV